MKNARGIVRESSDGGGSAFLNARTCFLPTSFHHTRSHVHAAELLRKGQGREAAEHFRDAAARARRRTIAGVDSHRTPRSISGDASSKGGCSDGGGVSEYFSTSAVVELSRNLRLEGIAVAMDGDRPSAEMLLRSALKELRAGGGSGGGARGAGGSRDEEEGLALAALGSLLAQEG